MIRVHVAAARSTRSVMVSRNKSIRTWTIAFLSVDLLFWIYLGFSCYSDTISCLEIVTFGGYFFYLPFTLLPWPIPAWCYVIVHAAIGAGIGWLLRKHLVPWWLAGIIAAVVLGGTAFGLARWQVNAELKRETTTQLWLVSEASRDELQFTVGKKLSNDNYAFEAGEITIYLNAYDTSDTNVILLRCDDAINCHGETVSFSNYLAAKTSCHQDKSACPYQGLQKYPTLFEVESNPKAILTMTQILY
jgi:hypothetical protein